MNDIKLVVLDLAGTTIEDTGQVSEAFTFVLNEYGINISNERLQAVRGASKREAIRGFVESRLGGQSSEIFNLTEQIFAAFCKRLATKYNEKGVCAIGGITETLQWLRGRKIKVALNTGFDRAITVLLLEALEWEKALVNTVICGDDVPRGRPAPYLIFRAMEATGVASVHEVVNVGDTVLDLAAGWNAGVRGNIGVLTGAHTKAQLERAPHTHIIPSVAALPALL
jgi:phosphonatase-like hydrolase